MPYNIYLADRGLPGSQIPADLKQVVSGELQSWFTAILPMSHPPITGGAAVTWVESPPQIQPNELLIFFVQSQNFSIVRHLPGINIRNRTRSGLTGWNSHFTCSEVYIDHGTRFLSQMAFHEALHNKTHLNNRRLHRNDGLAQEHIRAPIAPSDRNKRLMAEHLLSNKPQWIVGFRY